MWTTLSICSFDWLIQWLYGVQPTAFRCWSSSMSIAVPMPLSIVRGRSTKSDSMTPKATTGSATTCSVSWQWTTTTSWDLSCNYAITAGTGPSTVPSLYSVRRTTTGCWCPGTRVTLVMRSVTTTIWCSARMTVTTISAEATVHWATAADSGISAAITARSTVFAVDSSGISQALNFMTCRHHACGWRARSLHWLNR